MKRILNLLFLIVLAGLFLLPPSIAILRAVNPPQTVSYYENRTLAAVPKATKDSLWSGTFFTELDSFLSDYLPGRNTMIRIDTALDLALNRPVSHNVLVTDKRLLPFHGYSQWGTGYLEGLADNMGDTIAHIRDVTEEAGGSFFYLGIPQQFTYFETDYPDYTDNRSWLMGQISTEFSTALLERDITFVDADAIYADLGYPDAFFSDTDHHYTYRGMLAAYRGLMEEICAQTGLPLKIYADEDLSFQSLSSPFLGSRNRQIYGLWPTEEHLEIAYLKEEIPFRRTDNGYPVASSLYATLPDVGGNITYSAYMGGDIGETVIQTDRPDLPNLLIFGDSFTNPMETVIWASFNETRILDFRHYNSTTLSEYIKTYQPDIVVCLRDESAYLDFTGNGAVS